MKNNQTTSSLWTSAQAYTLAIICLAIGLGLGWFAGAAHSSSGAAQSSSGAAPSETATSTSAPNLGQGQLQGMQQMPSPADMKRMADKQAAPMLEQLKTRPNDPTLLAEIGNAYYDTQQYKEAVDYYKRSLQAQPTDVNVRTDMGTAYWYMHDPDTAISEFNKALTYNPTSANTLFNLGIVKWQGKSDANGALAAWNKLLQSNPDYPNKQKVLDLMQEAKQGAAGKP